MTQHIGNACGGMEIEIQFEGSLNISPTMYRAKLTTPVTKNHTHGSSIVITDIKPVTTTDFHLASNEITGTE